MNEKDQKDRTVLETIRKLKEESKDEHKIKPENERKPHPEDEQIAHLYITEYQGVPIAEFTRKLKTEHNIDYSRTTIRRKLIEQGVYEAAIEKETGKPLPVKFRTRNLYDLIINKSISEKLKDRKLGKIKEPWEIWHMSEEELNDYGEVTDQLIAKWIPKINILKEYEPEIGFFLIVFLGFTSKIIESIKWKKSRK